MINTQNTPPSSPTRPHHIINLFPCKGGDLAREVSSDTRNERVVTLAHLRERGINANNILTLNIKPDLWEIKKTLSKSDVGNHQTRLIIPKESVVEHILKYLTEDEIAMIEDQNHNGLGINVYDSDTKSIHGLCFKRWNSTGSYVLNNNWNRDFVQRRDLKEGEEIGLFWNTYESRLHFRVLLRLNR